MITPNYEITYFLTVFFVVTMNLHFGGTNTVLTVYSVHVVGIIRDLQLTIKELDDPNR